MGKIIDLTGQKFGKLTAIKYVGNKKWLCKCDCGNSHITQGILLRNNRVTSCGCATVRKVSKDLTGKTFNYLTVEGIAYRKKSIFWNCKCKCGNHTIVDTTHLVKGYTKSCGCLHKEVKASKRANIIGKRFGRLVALYYNNGFWHCKCDCGNEVDVTYTNLKRGDTTSCGCFNRERTHDTNFLDITGKKFGKLVAVKPIDKFDRTTVWKCECECGNIVNVPVSKLTSGHTRSCGCLNISHSGSSQEDELEFFINSCGDFIIEKHDRNILDGKEIDIYLPELKLGIEYCGSAFHASKNNIYENKDKYYHRDKFLLAKSNGVCLITVFDRFWEEDKIKIKELIRYKLTNTNMFLPITDTVITDNNYDDGIWLRNFGYEEFSQVDPLYFIYKDFLVYDCGKTIWYKNK